MSSRASKPSSASTWPCETRPQQTQPMLTANMIRHQPQAPVRTLPIVLTLRQPDEQTRERQKQGSFDTTGRPSSKLPTPSSIADETPCTCTSLNANANVNPPTCLDHHQVLMPDHLDLDGMNMMIDVGTLIAAGPNVQQSLPFQPLLHTSEEDQIEEVQWSASSQTPSWITRMEEVLFFFARYTPILCHTLTNPNSGLWLKFVLSFSHHPPCWRSQQRHHTHFGRRLSFMAKTQ